MARTPTTPWPTRPRSVFFNDVASLSTLRRAEHAGRIRRIASGVWSADLRSEADHLVEANIWEIVARFMPDAVIVDRSAASNGRIDGGIVTVATDSRSTPLELPGVTVVVRPRVTSESDLPWTHGLHMSGPARTLVDNLAPTRSRKLRARTLSTPELQDWLAAKLITWDSERLANLREEARAIASELGNPERRDLVDEIFAELDGRQPVRRPAGQLLLATRGGAAWDEERVRTFETIAGSLRSAAESAPAWLPPPEHDGEFPFYEAYFSNYIEGTEFSIEEARAIVDTQTPPVMRSADGHDILGTHRCVVDPVGRARTSTDADELIDLLVARHETILVGRPDMQPGVWKSSNNGAGTWTFVDHALVEGTLRRGLRILDEVPAGLARALYVMFVVSEVHPFNDGNGRVARLSMNAELSAVGACRIIVPTVARNEYLASLRRASTSGDVTALDRVLRLLWRWSSAMNWSDRASAHGMLVASNALLDSTEAADTGRHLILP